MDLKIVHIEKKHKISIVIFLGRPKSQNRHTEKREMFMPTIMRYMCKIWGFHGGDYEECSLSGMLRRVALGVTDVSGERNASIIRVTRVGELGTKFA
jgi:hypothetical protein